MNFGRTTIVEAVSLRGQSNGWITEYIIQFRNSEDMPYVCWNGCQPIAGNRDSNNEAILRFDHPLIASEIRIYAINWSQQITGRL